MAKAQCSFVLMVSQQIKIQGLRKTVYQLFAILLQAFDYLHKFISTDNLNKISSLIVLQHVIQIVFLEKGTYGYVH